MKYHLDRLTSAAMEFTKDRFVKDTFTLAKA